MNETKYKIGDRVLVNMESVSRIYTRNVDLTRKYEFGKIVIIDDDCYGIEFENAIIGLYGVSISDSRKLAEKDWGTWVCADDIVLKDDLVNKEKKIKVSDGEYTEKELRKLLEEFS